MSSNLDPKQIAVIIDQWLDWQDDKRMEHIIEFASQVTCTEPMIVAEACGDDVTKASAMLAVFTARAALKKVCEWFNYAGGWPQQKVVEFQNSMVAEIRDALLNCNTAMHYLQANNAQDGNAQDGPDSTEKGGES
jgi:hypothetical protein